jgi:glycosyltransferase involved in cell wall biosynthesis
VTRFSVIIPTYNRKDFLLKCLETVFNQLHAPYEVILVDDGSTDGTIEALAIFGNDLKIIEQTNAGPGAARNRGAEVASGDYLAFLDSDDLWFPWTLSTFSKLIEKYSRPSLLFGRFIDFQNEGDLHGFEREEPQGNNYADFLSSSADGRFCGAGMMVISRASFLSTAGFAEDFLNGEDHDLALTLGTAPGFVQVVAPIIIGHRVHDDNEMGDQSKTLKGVARLFLKEKAGEYPGGLDREIHRQEVIARHARAAVIGALKSGHLREAFSLYLATISWNLRLRRILYLAAVPLIALASTLRPRSSR